ncbi:MAG: fibronectin type III domain-containing protein [Bacteroidota bacterium]
MRAKETMVDQLLRAIANYVEYIANLDAPNAETIILSAAMAVKKQGSINIPILAANNGNVPNSVKLRRKSAGRGVAYKWQYSPDPFTDASWVLAGESTVASFEIDLLEPLKRYWFRVAIVKGITQNEFSDPVTFVIS